MSAPIRLGLAALVIVTLLGASAGIVFDIDWLRASAIAVFLFVELGIAPCLLLAPMPVAWFTLLAVTSSLAGTVSVGFTMAILHLWYPDVAMAVVTAVTIALLVPSVRRDIRGLRQHEKSPLSPGHRRASVMVGSLTGAGLLIAIAAAVTHQSTPQKVGLFISVGPFWYLGLALLVAAAAYAHQARTTPALPVLTLSAIVVLSQAIAYGSPTVATAARHVGVVQYIRANGGLKPSLDIYQAWSGLFAGTAWLCDAGRIADPMIIATWWPVLLSLMTALAVVLLARRWFKTESRAWFAGVVFALSSTLNIVYFSPQSLGILLAVVIFAIVVSPRTRRHRSHETFASESGAGREQETTRKGRLASLRTQIVEACHPIGPWRALFVLYLSCVLAVTHQISPYLTVAALGVLWIMGYTRPLWVLLLIVVPALAWAGINTDTLGRFISLGSVGRFWENAQSPSHANTQLPVPEITRLTFDIPATVLLVVGLVAAYYVLRRRTRPAWALALAAASPVTLFAVTDYGQEGIFRVTLFAAPWLSILAVGIMWPAFLRLWRIPVLATGLAILLAANVFGQTALDWNRITPRDTAQATALFENSAPDRSIMFLTGTSVVSPINISAHYLDVGYVGREVLKPFPSPDKPYNAAADVRTLTQRLVKNWPAPRYYALVSETIGAYDARYGYQSYDDYRKLAAAMATSPLWRPIFTGPTTTMYALAETPAG
jgi:hypothetical protein